MDSAQMQLELRNMCDTNQSQPDIVLFFKKCQNGTQIEVT